MHLLTNAEIAILNIDEPPEEVDPPEEQTPAVGAALARMATRRRRKRRDSAAVRGEKLSEEQMTQVDPRTPLHHSFLPHLSVAADQQPSPAGMLSRYMSEWPTRLILRAPE